MSKRTHLEIRSRENVLNMIDKGYLIVGKHYYYRNIVHKDIRAYPEYNKCDVELLESGEWRIKKFDNSGDMYISTSISGLANKLYKVFAPWVIRRISENGWKKVYFKSGPYKDKPLCLLHDFYSEYKLRKYFPENRLKIMKNHKDATKKLKQYEKGIKDLEEERKRAEAERLKKDEENIEIAQRIQNLRMREEERKIFLRMKRRELKMKECEALHKKRMAELRDDTESSDDESSDDEGAFD